MSLFALALLLLGAYLGYLGLLGKLRIFGAGYRTYNRPKTWDVTDAANKVKIVVRPPRQCTDNSACGKWEVCHEGTCQSQPMEGCALKTKGKCPDGTKEKGGICCPSSCFAQGTPVLTPSGARPIESLKVGDEIVSCSTTGTLVRDTVAYVHHPPNSTLAEFVAIRTDSGRSIRATADHLLCVGKVGNLAPAGAVKIGDTLVNADGSAATVVGVDLVSQRGVYDLLPRKEPFLVANGFVASPQCLNSVALYLAHQLRAVPLVTRVCALAAACVV